jgi:hypothetical protein
VVVSEIDWENLSLEELQELYQIQKEYVERLEEEGPADDDELHEWIKQNLDIDIPRVAVCEDHTSPFQFIADLYFERQTAALLMASRGSGKTFMVAILHWINSRFKPGIESVTFGAIEFQSFAAYNHLKNWVYDKDGNKRPEIVESQMRETLWKNGSKVRVLGSTASAVNGPHPQVAHADEIELMQEDTFRESRNMTMGIKLRDGRFVKPQDVMTSTRKGPNGRMQLLIDEIETARAKGARVPRKLYAYCIFETAAQNTQCRVARPDLPEEEKCDCHKIPKGEWDDGSERTLEGVCGGKFYKSRGWQPFDNVIKHFTENDRTTFEVQQLCAKPEMKFHYIPNWRDDKYCIRDFPVHPENGPIFMVVDWGGTDPHAVAWYQWLKNPVECYQWFQPEDTPTIKTTIKPHTLVCFDEIYVAEIGNEKLGDLVIRREEKWKRQVPGFRIKERFCDPANKGARLDWKAMGLPTIMKATRDFDEQVKNIRDIFDDDLFRVDGKRCKNWVREVKGWRADERTGQEIHDSQHLMAGFRYLTINLKKDRAKYIGSGQSAPMAKKIHRKASPGMTTVMKRPEVSPYALPIYRKHGDGDWRERIQSSPERDY